MKCGVWSVKTLLRLSLKKNRLSREGHGRDRFFFKLYIGHFLGNFRRRLARVLVIVSFCLGLLSLTDDNFCFS